MFWTNPITWVLICALVIVTVFSQTIWQSIRERKSARRRTEVEVLPGPLDYVDFEFQIEEILYLGPGDHYDPHTLLSGRLIRGAICAGQCVRIPTHSGEHWLSTVSGIEFNNKVVPQSTADEGRTFLHVVFRGQPKGLVCGVAVAALDKDPPKSIATNEREQAKGSEANQGG